MPVDLHSHSLFSVDGFVTPEELADSMHSDGIGVMSLTDHNSVDGLTRGRARAAALGVRFINGVELDAMWKMNEYHFLAFGFHPGDPGLRSLCARQFLQYSINFYRFLPVLERLYGITAEQLSAGLSAVYRTHPSPVLNKWFARRFLLAEGYFADEYDARVKMPQIVAEAESLIRQPWNWSEAREVIDTVHGAGGIVLLAHVGKHHRGNLRRQVKLIEELMAIGVDGFELYHRANLAEPHFAKLESMARSLMCPVSGGTDTHSGQPGAHTRDSGLDVPEWVVDTIEMALERRGNPCR